MWLVRLAVVVGAVASPFTIPAPRACNTTISSKYEGEGVVTSPSFPSHYPPHTTCVTTFSGAPHQRLQLVFTHMGLGEPPHQYPQHVRCTYGDHVGVYNLRASGVRQEVDHFCGNKVPPSLMSSGPGMQLVFRTGEWDAPREGQPPSKIGFQARFKFISNLGISSAQQSGAPGECHFTYTSEVSPNGTLTSPNPGGVYPLDTTCIYVFQGRKGQIVRIIFKYFHIEGVLPCDAVSESDYLEFSNFRSADRKIPVFCGSLRPSVVHSDSSFFRVTFRSNGKFAATGFEADYQFLDMRRPYAIKRYIGAPRD